MVRRLRWAALPAVIALALTGCGGGHAVNVTKVIQQVQAQDATHCTAQDYAAECVLPSEPVVPHFLNAAFDSAVHLEGIDFAWTKFGPSASYAFGASYLSNDPSKNWNRSLIAQYHNAHKGTVAVLENGGTRAAQGCAAGASDARSAEAQLAFLGFPHSHFDMAIDFDASGTQVFSYFSCANQAEPGLVGAYGGYFPLQYLCAKGVITKSWQTYAWSRGLWLPASCAPLEQYLNGSSFDHDRAVAPDYGQFPTPAPPGPSQATIHAWQAARNSSFKHYRGDSCHAPQDHVYCGIDATRVQTYQNKLWTVYPRWSCWGPKARSKSVICWIVRPEVSVWSQKRDSTDNAMQRNGCNGPVSFPVPSHTPLCNKLRQRRSWFAAHVDGVFKAYS